MGIGMAGSGEPALRGPGSVPASDACPCAFFLKGLPLAPENCHPSPWISCKAPTPSSCPLPKQNQLWTDLGISSDSAIKAGQETSGGTRGGCTRDGNLGRTPLRAPGLGRGRRRPCKTRRPFGPLLPHLLPSLPLAPGPSGGRWASCQVAVPEWGPVGCLPSTPFRELWTQGPQGLAHLGPKAPSDDSSQHPGARTRTPPPTGL